MIRTLLEYETLSRTSLSLGQHSRHAIAAAMPIIMPIIMAV
jgi:hypothetical protein